jgi:hypothetical protein
MFSRMAPSRRTCATASTRRRSSSRRQIADSFDGRDRLSGSRLGALTAMVAARRMKRDCA